MEAIDYIDNVLNESTKLMTTGDTMEAIDYIDNVLNESTKLMTTGNAVDITRKDLNKELTSLKKQIAYSEDQIKDAEKSDEHKWAAKEYKQTILSNTKRIKEIEKQLSDMKSMSEADETSEPKVISQLRKITEEQQADKVTDPKTGKKKMVDGWTANAIVKLWDAMSAYHRAKFTEKIIPMGLVAMSSFAFKFVV